MAVAVGGGAEFPRELEHAIQMRVVKVGGRREQALAVRAGVFERLHGLAPGAIQDRSGGADAGGGGVAAPEDVGEGEQGGMALRFRDGANLRRDSRTAAGIASGPARKRAADDPAGR
jgi:hypothetical protein